MMEQRSLSRNLPFENLERLTSNSGFIGKGKLQRENWKSKKEER